MLRRCWLISAAALLILPGCVEVHEESLVVLHAGSLSHAFEEIERRYEGESGERVVRESSGSVAAVRKVVDLGRKVDVVAVADYRLIPGMMSGYSDWYIIFASNSMVVASRDTSANWTELITREDVSVGFTNPNLDPCGYRALMVMKLADLRYGTSIFKTVVEEHTNIREKDGIIEVPDTLEVDGEKVFTAGTELELSAYFQAGEIDMLFLYRNVAATQGFSYVELPEEVNLGSPDADYSDVSVHVSGQTLSASPILYGVTVPNNAPHGRAGVDLVRFLLTEGGSIMEDSGFTPLSITPALSDVPPELQPYVQEEKV